MSAISPSEGPEASQRRERAAIAAQACQTCRNRKSKCDERRPKCSLCTRLNVECEYREPLPTKKDKTMVHILDTLTRLENKFDNLSMSRGTRTPPDDHSPAFATSSLAAGSSATSLRDGSKGSEREATQSFRPKRFPTELQQQYKHLTVPHKIMLWPSIYIHLINSGISAASDLQYVLQEGTPFIIKRELQKHLSPLPSDAGLPYFAVNVGAAEHGQSSNVAFPTLTVQQIQEYSDAYFNTFNVLYPVLNRESFMNDIVARLLREGYGDGDVDSVLALFVFALGQVALEGVFDRPVSIVDGKPSGIRGGTLEHPPGLAIFNEGRRRLGFVATQCSLENVQILLLQATYYEACARHLDFWRSTVAASMACQVLIRCQTIDWSWTTGDLIKRAYWTCILSEELYHLDLDMPQTGIHTMEDDVPLPYFQENNDDDRMGVYSPQTPVAGSEDRNQYQYYFLAMIALRRLIARIHGVIHESSTTQDSADDYGGPPVAVIREMVRQLDSWRALLPRPLQWSDNDKFDFPTADPNSRRPNEPLFNFDPGTIPIGHRYNLDVVTAQLRTRFYYARFMMYRPFVYKALHFPELMTADDANCCALAIKSACLWPLSLSPPKNKKRLVPHLFAWTQNFVGILLIFRMCNVNSCLSTIVDEGGVVGRQEIDLSTQLMLEWVRDVRQVDGIAEWSWNILEPLYGDRLR